MKSRNAVVVLSLAGLLALAGCQSRSGSSTSATGAPGSYPAFPIEYFSSAVTVAEGETVRVQLLNATDREQTAVVEIRASKGEDLVNTRGTATEPVKTETQRLNPWSVGTTEFKTKTAGVCCVHIRTADPKIIPQVAFGQDKEPRLVFKPGDLVRADAVVPYPLPMRGSTGYSTGLAPPTGSTAATTKSIPMTAPATTGAGKPAASAAGLERSLEQERQARIEAEEARRRAEQARREAEAALANAEAKLDQTGATSFSLTGTPALLELKPGETSELTLQIRRGKAFQQKVDVGADLPRGLNVEPRKFSFTTGKDSAPSKTVKISVSKNAVPGEHFITFTGYPEDGAIASVQLTVRVKQP